MQYSIGLVRRGGPARFSYTLGDLHCEVEPDELLVAARPLVQLEFRGPSSLHEWLAKQCTWSMAAATVFWNSLGSGLLWASYSTVSASSGSARKLSVALMMRVAAALRLPTEERRDGCRLLCLGTSRSQLCVEPV